MTRARVLRAAVGQFAPTLGDVTRNVERCVRLVADAAAGGATLLVLPECALTGYVFEDRAAAVEVATAGRAALEELAHAAAAHELLVVVGTLGVEDGALRNRAVLLGPAGVEATYNKTHLPFLGVDRFVAAGEAPLVPVRTPVASLGLQVCYDLRFPEVTRCQVLAGAEVIAHPTAWGMNAADTNAEFLTRARAFESGVFLLTANRVGTEGALTFCGRSQIVDPHGRVLARADVTGDALLLADLDLGLTAKHLVVEPGAYEMDLLADRRPELYGGLGSRGTSQPAATDGPARWRGRVFVSVDMEGIAGVVMKEHTDGSPVSWERCRKLMTAEAVAAVEGAREAGATEVLVVDAHGNHDNLLPERFCGDGVRILHGPHTHFTMVEGLDASYDVALFVGYHERAGGGDGVLNHTMYGDVVAGLELDGVPVGEIAVNAAVAGAHGVPVGLVTGDHRCCAEAAAVLPDAVLVEVKQALDTQAATTLPPAAACDRVRAGAKQAVERARAAALRSLPAGPAHYALTCHTTTQAHMAAIVPGVIRTGPLTVEARDDDPLVAYRLMFSALLVAAGATP